MKSKNSNLSLITNANSNLIANANSTLITFANIATSPPIEFDHIIFRADNTDEIFLSLNIPHKDINVANTIITFDGKNIKDSPFTGQIQHQSLGMASELKGKNIICQITLMNLVPENFQTSFQIEMTGGSKVFNHLYLSPPLTEKDIFTDRITIVII